MVRVRGASRQGAATRALRPPWLPGPRGDRDDLMKLGWMAGYWMFGPVNPVPTAVECEKLGYDCVFTAEAYGSDVFSPLCWIGAHTERIRLGTGIMQISARTPACAAMTAGIRAVTGLAPRTVM